MEVFQTKIPPNSSGPWYFWIKERLEVIVFRDASGKFRAFRSLCPHMGAQLKLSSSGEDLVCPWHGLCISIDGNQSNHHRYHSLEEFGVEHSNGELRIYARRAGE